MLGKASGTCPATNEQELKATLQSALANVVDLQTQNKLLLEQLKGANAEIADSAFRPSVLIEGSALVTFPLLP